MSASVVRRAVLIGALLAVFGVPLPASAADVVKVGVISRNFFDLPLLVAVNRGLMKREGLDVQIVQPGSSAKVNEALRAGEVQVVMRSPETAMMDAYRGGPLRVIAGGINKLPHFIIAQPRIKTFADLRGANFGILAEKEGTTYIVQDIAKAVGLTPADYKMTVVGGSPARFRLLKEGKIDVGLQPIPNSYEAEAAGFTNLGSVTQFVPDWQFTVVNVDYRWADKNRDVVVRFLRGLQHGRDFMRTNPAEAARIGAQEFRTDVALAARMLADNDKYGMHDPQMALNMPGLRRVFETLQQAGDLPADRPFDLKVFADLSYYQQSRDPADPPFTATTPPRR